MELYESVEVCPYCDRENVYQWNVEIMGYIAVCQHCGKEIMLCDECQYWDKNPCKCDWCDDCGGVCCKDDRPIILETYGDYDGELDLHDQLSFSVPKNWLKKYISDKWDSLDNFLNSYTKDISLAIYEDAFVDGVILHDKMLDK